MVEGWEQTDLTLLNMYTAGESEAMATRSPPEHRPLLT
jgi:hypothetical protein